MPFEMIDPIIADKVRESIREGDEVEFLTGPEKRVFLFKVLEIKPYSFIVTSSHLGGANQKLELSIVKTVQYQKETEIMRMKAPPHAHTATPAPAPVPAPDGAIPRMGMSVPMPASTKPPAPAASGQEASLDPNWIEQELNDACQDFAQNIKTILKGIVAVAESAAVAGDQMAAPVKPFSCFDCAFVNVDANRCDKYSSTPPMAVLVDPVNNAVWKCPDFYAASLMFQTTDDEIPF